MFEATQDSGEIEFSVPAVDDEMAEDHSAVSTETGSAADVISLPERRAARHKLQDSQRLYPGKSDLAKLVRNLSEVADVLWEGAADENRIVREDACRRARLILAEALLLADRVGPGTLIVANGLLSSLQLLPDSENLPDERLMRVLSGAAREFARAPLPQPAEAARQLRDLRGRGVSTTPVGAAGLANEILRGEEDTDG